MGIYVQFLDAHWPYQTRDSFKISHSKKKLGILDVAIV